MSLNETVTGQDALVKVGDREIPIQNVSFDVDLETTEVQHNNGLNAKVSVTGRRFSGSFEYQGQNDTLQEVLYEPDGANEGFGEYGPKKFTINVYTDDKTYVLINCTITSRSQDIPSDDVMTVSYDFVAEEAQTAVNVDGPEP